MSTKFDDYTTNKKFSPEEEKKMFAYALIMFMVGVALLCIDYIIKSGVLAGIGFTIMLLPGLVLIAAIEDYLKKSKQKKKIELDENKKDDVDKNSFNEMKNFDVIQCVVEHFNNSLNHYNAEERVVVLNASSKFLYTIFLKFDLSDKTMQMYHPFCYPKNIEEVDIPYGKYLANLHEFMNKLNVKYRDYKFYSHGTIDAVGLVSIDYPLIEGEDIIDFLENEIENLKQVLDEVYPIVPDEYMREIDEKLS